MYDLEEKSIFKRMYKKFDAFDPAALGIISYFVLMTVYSFLPYRTSEMSAGQSPTMIEAIAIVTVLFLLFLPTLLFLKGIIQNRVLVISILGFMFSLGLSGINLVRFIDVVNRLFIAQSIPIL